MEGLHRVMDWTTIITAAVAGAGAGVISSLLAPWVAWAIEKRRQAIDYKRELIGNARTALAEAMAKEDDEIFVKSAAYHALRPYLNEKAVGMLEAKYVGYSDGDRVGAVNGELIDAIAKLEREWGLISGRREPRLPSRVPVHAGHPPPWKTDG